MRVRTVAGTLLLAALWPSIKMLQLWGWWADRQQAGR